MANTKQLVVHHDDLGGSHSANIAFLELVELGVVTCGSVMVSAPWFTEVANFARHRPELDIGVHLTLTSEFPEYRWRPLTSGPTLVDGAGFLWPDNAGARTADPDEVRIELIAQIDTALASGIDVTHLDSHMGTGWQPEFIEIYLELGKQYRLPIVVTQDVSRLSAPHTNLEHIFDRLRERLNPMFQRFLTTPFGNDEPRIRDYQDIFSQAEEGLNWCGFHFAAPGDIEFMTGDASTRIAEYELFRSGEMSDWMKSAGFDLVGMREYRERMRS